MYINPIIIYFVAINILGAIINIIDKQRAKKNKWRIKESTLWLIGILGGALGSYITMKAIRHKTKHNNFMIGMPMLVIVNITILVLLIK